MEKIVNGECDGKRPSSPSNCSTSIKKQKCTNTLKNPIGASSKDISSLSSWDNLSTTIKTELLEKVKVNCGIELTSSSDILQSSSALSRLLNSPGRREEDSSLFGDMIRDYVAEKLQKISDKPPDDYIEDLGRISAKCLFPNERDLFLEDGKEYQLKYPSYLNNLVSMRLLKQSSENKFEFVNDHAGHYFFAIFLQKFGATFSNLCKLVLELEEVTVTVGGHSIQSYEFKNKLTIYFINYLKNYGEGFHIGNEDLTRVGLACIMGNWTNMLESILTKVPVTSEMLVIAIEFGDSRTTDLIFQKYEEVSERKVSSFNFHQFSLLHMAVERGNANLVQKLLTNYGYAKELRRKDLRNVVHICVEYTCDMTQKEIEERKEIVSEIHKADPRLLNAKDAKWVNTPILCDKVHLSLIQHMVNLGADIYACDDDERTLAHVTVAGLTPQQYHNVILYLNNSGYEDLLRSRDFCEATPLHYAVIFLDLLEDTLEIYENAGVGVNDLDEFGRTMLHIAVGKGRSPQFLKMLVRRGADVNTRDKDGHSPLHCVVVEAPDGNKEIVQTLLELGADVNGKDNGGHTPLWWALKGLNKDRLNDVLELLKVNGALE